MFKQFIRWLFIKTHIKEINEVNKIYDHLISDIELHTSREIFSKEKINAVYGVTYILFGKNLNQKYNFLFIFI